MKSVELVAILAVYESIYCSGYAARIIRNHQTRRRPTLVELRLAFSSETTTTLSSLSDTLTRQILTSADPIQARLDVLNSRQQSIRFDRTTVGPSSLLVGERGLFATVDCQIGDLLTCYPGDGIISTPDNNNNRDDWTINWGNHVNKNHRSMIKDLPDDLFGYILSVDDDYGILGLPEYDDNPAYLGHFVNDGVKRLPTCESELAQYVLESNEACNAMHQGISGDSHMVTVATKHIAAGDEIFVMYGPEYWKEQPTFVENDKGHNNDARNSATGSGFG